MDSSKLERWLKVALLGTVHLNRSPHTSTEQWRRAQTRSPPERALAADLKNLLFVWAQRRSSSPTGSHRVLETPALDLDRTRWRRTIGRH